MQCLIICSFKAARTACVAKAARETLVRRRVHPVAFISSARPPGLHNNNKDGPIAAFVEDQIRLGKIREDEEQRDLALRLDSLRRALADVPPNNHQLSVDLFSDAPPRGLVARAKAWARPWWPSQQRQPTPRGLYIHGHVGVGKSFLMDLFASHCQGQAAAAAASVRRIHFNEFMLDVHDRIHQFKQQHPKADPLPSLAFSLAQDARLWCLDEFQVTDIADALILKRLWSLLWQSGVGTVLVATSNRAPEALYEGGLNRSLFLPFVDTLKQHMDVVEMTGNKDYRREQLPKEVIMERSYFWPADSKTTRQALDRIFCAQDGSVVSEQQQVEHLPVRMNRQVIVPRSNRHCAWFDFDDLCNRPLGAADYLAVCEQYPILIVDNVPQLDGSRFNEARRFVTLIDALYESQTRLVLASQVPLDQLLVGFDATVESNHGDEEIAVASAGQESGADRQQQPRNSTAAEDVMFVKGEGGSSSSASTTMIRTTQGEEVEWSATGRIGVSLAQLSAVRDVSFSFQRAESRLVEMNNGTWGRPII